MTKKIFLLIICVSVFTQSNAFCKRKRKKKQKATSTQIAKESTIPSNFLVVSFISKASGIDRASVTILENEIKDFNTKNKTATLQFELRPWGREGERDYCIMAKNQDYLNKFASIIKSKFEGNTRIFVKENGVCKEKRN